MYTIEVSGMPFGALEFATQSANGRLSEDGTICHFSTKEDLEQYERFLRGPSWERFRLDNFVFQLLKFMDMDKAWHFYSIFNVNTKAPSDPFHGIDLTKTLLGGVHEFAVSGNHVDLRVVILTVLFQSFNHSLGRLSAEQDAIKAQTAFKQYLYYRFVDPQIAQHVMSLLFIETAKTTMSREARLVRDLNRAVVALKPPQGTVGNLYDRLYIEQRTAHPQLDRKTFLTQELKRLATTQFETSWARAVLLPVWQHASVNWAAQFSAAHDLRFDSADLEAFFLSRQPAPVTHSLTMPGNLSALSTLT